MYVCVYVTLFIAMIAAKGNSKLCEVHTVFLNRYQAGIIEPVDLSTVYFIG